MNGSLIPAARFRASATSFVNRVRRRVSRRRLESAMRLASGVIHVGANAGQERESYAEHGLPVLWIEPIPSVYDELRHNIAELPRQRCANALVADRDGQRLTLHIASNGGASSSIFEFADHRKVWPEISYVDEVTLESVTLPSLLRKENVEPGVYDILVLDTQGSELLILRGAQSLLPHFNYITVEVADFDSYAGCAKRHEVTSFLAGHGFNEWAVSPFRETEGDGPGRYYNITYRNRHPRSRRQS